MYVLLVTHSSIYRATTVPNRQVALVLGASIRSSGALSPVLKERVDAALLLYDTKKVSKILVSGDNGSVEYDEVYPVGTYLLKHGVPKEDIFLDYAGFDTYSSVYRAQQVFGVASVVVVSQRFHLPRALFIARSLGMSAVGLDSSYLGDHYYNNALREIPATTKAVYDLVTKRVPVYLGLTFNVAGSGEATWVGPEKTIHY